MGTFVCDKCEKRWPDIGFYCCPECYPRRALFHVILSMTGLIVFVIGFFAIVLAAIAWFGG